MKTKLKLIIFIMLMVLAIIAIPQCSNAALQSNGQAGATKNIDQWMLQIRQMESLGGGLGLSETVNATGLKATTPSNNVDVHMQKNTEYGALVILSASSYGKPNKMNAGETTTGNSTGVVMPINKEWVSAGISESGGDKNIWNKAVGRYKNLYSTNSSSRKKGDAMLNWHGSGKSQWFTNADSGENCGLVRSHSGSVFSYDGYVRYTDGDAHPTNKWASRACLVMGADF